MKTINIINTSKLKKNYYKDIQNQYLKRINLFNIKIYENVINILNLIKKIAPNPPIILLSETGEKLSSIEFSKYISKILEEKDNIFIIIGGPNGHNSSLLKENYKSISLSNMTFPNQWARLMLIEQIYRSQSILTRHPYHK